MSNIVDVGLKSGTQAALAGAQVAEAAPSHFEDKGNFAAGLTKTVEETGGLLTGVMYQFCLNQLLFETQINSVPPYLDKCINLAKVRIGLERLRKIKRKICASVFLCSRLSRNSYFLL